MNDMPSLERVVQGDSSRTRTPTGQWQKGVSGNPKGYNAGRRHRATILAQRLFDGESDELCRLVIAQAKRGDQVSQRLCLERICPPFKCRPLRFKLPKLHTISDAQNALAMIVAAVANGTILADEAATLSSIISSFVKTIEVAEIETRIAALEAQNAVSQPAAMQYNA